MSAALLPVVATALSAVFAVLLLDQWWRARRPYQVAWAVGVAMFGVAALTEVVGSLRGWDEGLYRIWYLTGALWVAAWLGLGTVMLLERTRFGYAFALSLVLAGLFTFLARHRYGDAGAWPIAYLAVAGVLAIFVVWDTYTGGTLWPRLFAAVLVAGTVVSAVMLATAPLGTPDSWVVPATGLPDLDLLPGRIRLLSPLFNVTGGLALVFGAVFSTYIFMPKRRLLHYSLDPDQKADELAFNLAISLIAFPVNFVASLPGAARAFVAGRLHSRVPATILIALGATVASVGTGLARFGEVRAFDVSLVAGLGLLFAGFLASVETFRDLRIPFTSRLIWQRAPEAGAGPAGEDR
jgi:hypothetical protein